jgi:hypothetical protein
VIGGGRSGTSLATRIIGLLGVDLGPEESMLETNVVDNAKGYWEQQAVMALNDELLAIYGATWDRPTDLPAGWERDPRVEPLYDRARELLAEHFGGATRWGWKDPRSSLTLPFWQRVVGPMRYVLCFRNPLEVAESLAARDPVHHPLDDSLALWLRYSALAVENASGHPHLILQYENWFSAPERQLERLKAFIGGEQPDGWEERARDFLDAGLRHHQRSPDALLHDERVPVEVRAFYALLPKDTIDRATAHVLSGLWSGFQRRAALELEAEHDRAETGALREEVTMLHAEQAALRAALTKAGAEIAQGHADVERLESDLAAHRDWLDDVQSSRSWRLTAFLRTGTAVARRMRA